MKFSVITPFYNIEQYVEQCVKSILNQNFFDFEFIAVDDGSTDKTGKILDELALSDNRMTVIHKSNGGLTSARKAGASISKGEYVIIVDGDDWIDEGYLRKIAEILETNPVDVVITGYFEAYDDKLIRRSPYLVENRYGYIDRSILETKYLPNLFSTLPIVWAKAFKRELYLKYQMSLDDSITMGEDGAISYPCIVNAQSIYTLDEPLYYYRQNPLSMTKHPKKYLSWEASVKRIKHLESILPLNKYNLVGQLYGAAAHSIFNVVSSHFRMDSYKSVKKETLQYLDDRNISEWLRVSQKNSRGSNRIVAFILNKRLFFLMKLWTYIR